MHKNRYEIPLNFDEEIPDTIRSKFQSKKHLKTKISMDDNFLDDYVIDDFNQNDYSEFFGSKSNAYSDDDLYNTFEEDSYSPH